MEYRLNGGGHDAPTDLDSVVSAVRSDAGSRFDPVVIEALQRVSAQVCSDLTASIDESNRANSEQSTSPSPSNDVSSTDGTSTRQAAVHTVRETDGTKKHEEALAALRSTKAVCEASDLIERIRTFDSPESWSPAIQGVLRVTQSQGCSARDVAKAVSQDPLLSMRVLRLANTSPFARKRSVDSILDAVTVLGINEIRNLALTCQVFDRFGSGVSGHIDAGQFWEHSVACGLIAAHLGTIDSEVDPFVCGILHDAGRLILLRVAPDEYAEVLSTSEELDLPLEIVESRLLGTTHGAVLGELMKTWGFSNRLSEMVVRHHDSIRTISRLPKNVLRDVATIALSDRMAHALLLGASGNERLYPIADLIELLGVKEAQLAAAIGSTLDELPSIQAVMALNDKHDVDADSSAPPVRKLAKTAIPLIIDGAAHKSTLELWRRAAVGEMPESVPTIAVVHIASPASTNRVMRRLIKCEQSEGATNLPTIVIASGSSIEDCPELSTRRSVILHSPVRCDLLASHINDLLSDEAHGRSSPSAGCGNANQYIQIQVPS